MFIIYIINFHSFFYANINFHYFRHYSCIIVIIFMIIIIHFSANIIFYFLFHYSCMIVVIFMTIFHLLSFFVYWSHQFSGLTSFWIVDWCIFFGVIWCSSVPRSKEGRGGCQHRKPITWEAPSKNNTNNHNNAFNTNNEINTNNLNNQKICK